MVRAGLALLATGLVALAGCGGSGDDTTARTTPDRSARDVRSLGGEGVDKLSRPQIERFAHVRLPASATGVRSFYRTGMDTQVLVSMRVPRADLDAFVRSGGFRSPLAEGDRAIASSTGRQLGWSLDSAKRVKGLADTRTGLGRNLVVVLDDPAVVTVYLEAATF